MTWVDWLFLIFYVVMALWFGYEGWITLFNMRPSRNGPMGMLRRLGLALGDKDRRARIRRVSQDPRRILLVAVLALAVSASFAYLAYSSLLAYRP